MKRFTLAFSLIIFPMLIWCSDLHAKRFDPDRFLPIKDLFSAEDIRRLFYNIRFKPLGREDLAFNMLVPKNWKDMPVKVTKEQLTSSLLQGENAKEAYQKALKQGIQRLTDVTMARIRAPKHEKGYATIEVTCFRTPFETNIKDWVDFIIHFQKWERLLARQGMYNGRKVKDVLFRVKQKGEAFLTRLTASKHGTRIFIIYCSALESFYCRYAKIFGAAAVSFTVKQKSPSPFAEPMKTYSGKRRPLLKFRYPSSWTIKEPEKVSRGTSGVDLSIRFKGEKGQKKIGAFLHVKAISHSLKESTDSIFQKLKRDFTAAGIKLIEAGDAARLRGRFIRPPLKAEVWDVSIGGEKGELVLALFSRRDCYVGLGLLVPGAFGSVESLAGYREMEIVAADLLSGQPSKEAAKKSVSLEKVDPKKLVNKTMYLFVDAVKSGDFSKLYGVCARSWKKEITAQSLADAFSSFVENKIDLSVIKEVDPVLEERPRIRLDRPLVLKGKYYASMMTVKFKLTYGVEDDQWKLMGMNIGTGAPEPPPGRVLKVPPRATLVKLVNSTMMDLASSVKRNDFTRMYNNISQLWQRQTSKEKLAHIFSSFVENDIDLMVIKGREPVFDTTPRIEDGELHVKGYYDTSKMKVLFNLKYWMEGEDWRLMSVHVRTK